MPTTPALDTIRSRAAAGMRGYETHQGAERTLFAKEVANAFLDARTHFVTRDGKPDYLGRSGAYRAFVAEALDEAEIARENRAALQAAIRYHVSPLLRERFGEEVAALGLEPGSSVERARRRKERDSRILSLFAGGSEITDASDASLVANLARLAVSRIASLPSDTPALTLARTREEFKHLAEAVAAAEERLSKLAE
ncbi:hypothetical protein SEA_CARON_24 [Microbacterium phage Caron]|uniref:Uncharacterized protein n=1 Tax=Microbacterium phage Caron TaxID=3028494 RepID=A0AAE9ZRR2_9CAUD|nr:hypothetical protein SEA_CARON_24 [Microbacterium phage Caron]